MRKTGKEIGFGVAKGTIGADVVYEWLSSATAQEIQEYIRGVGSLAPTWSAFGRDALNVLLSNENMKLQTEIKDMTHKMETMTRWVTWLTVVIAILTFIQAVPVIKTFFNSPGNVAKIINDTPKTESNTNQGPDTNQLQNKNNDTIKKTEVIKHKEAP